MYLITAQLCCLFKNNQSKRFGINLDAQHVNGMTHFNLALSINLNTQHDNDSKWKIGKNDNFVQMTSVWRKADEKEFEAGWADVRVTASKSI